VSNDAEQLRPLAPAELPPPAGLVDASAASADVRSDGLAPAISVPEASIVVTHVADSDSTIVDPTELMEAEPDVEAGTDNDTIRQPWWRRVPAGLFRYGRGMSIWQWLMLLVIGAYTAMFTSRSLSVHHGLGTSAYDYGLYDQGVWLLSRFKAPFVTLMGRNLFGDHTSFILIFLVPIYWVFPNAGTLFFAQSLAIGMGALPVFLYARHRLQNEALACMLGVVYLLHPAVGWTNSENFHPDSFIGVFVGFAIYAALMKKWRMYLVFVVLALLVKEDASLILVPIGIWVALRRDRRIGLLTVLGSLGFMAFAMFVVMKSLIGVATRNTWRIPFGGPGKLAETGLKKPGDLWNYLRSDDKPFYLWKMCAPLAFIFLRSPDVALISALVLFTNILSTFWYQYQIEYHYSLVVVPALAIGTVYAIAAVRERWQPRLVMTLGVIALWTAYLWGPAGLQEAKWVYWPPNHPVAEAARDIITDIPDDAVVSSFHSLTAHINHREQIYQFPTPFRAVLYGVDDSLANKRLPAADQVEFVVLPVNRSPETEADWQLIKKDFELVRANEGWELFRRTLP
jgi:uncharacterized membrane protein